MILFSDGPKVDPAQDQRHELILVTACKAMVAVDQAPDFGRLVDQVQPVAVRSILPSQLCARRWPREPCRDGGPWVWFFAAHESRLKEHCERLEALSSVYNLLII